MNWLSNILLLILVFLVGFSVYQSKIQNEANISFWAHREGSKLYANTDNGVLKEMGIERTAIQKELHLVFQLFGALHRQKQLGVLGDYDWDNIKKEFRFIINNEFGKEYWTNHIAKYQSWQKNFIDYGNSLIKGD